MTLSSKTKSILFIVFEILMLVLAIGGFGWSDYAKTKFWWTTWDILGVLGIIGFIGGIWWYASTKQQN